MTANPLSIVPMPVAKVPAYFRGFVDWYAEALAELGHQGDDDLHAHVSNYLKPWLDADGLPLASTVFDILLDDIPAPIGAAWCGGTDFGFGPVFYIHDLRIFAPWRGKGYAKAALETIYALSKVRSGARGVGLSVLTHNVVARRLYETHGFVPISQIMIRPF
jgi:ribosomal protein S18 acetylase RimI-like enzyme